MCVQYKRAWKFLRELAELIEVSYRTWWPGQAVAFASDNWQTERSWSRGRLGQSNNKDTNILQQAEYKIAWPLVEWHVLGDLHTFGLRLKPFDDLRLDDFKVDGGQTVFAKLLSEFHLVQGTKGRTLVQRKLYTLECSIHVEHYPSKLYTKPAWNFLTTEDGTGPAYRILPEGRWRAFGGRVLKLAFNNTQKPEEVGRGEAEFARNFHVGTAHPSREWCLHFGDFLLFRNRLVAMTMNESELEARRVKSMSKGKANGEEEVADDPAHAPPDVAATAAALDIYLETTPRKQTLYLLARKWCGDGNKKKLREQAGLTGTDQQMNLKQMNKGNLVKILKYHVSKHKKQRAVAAPPATSPAAPSTPPVATPPAAPVEAPVDTLVDAPTTATVATLSGVGAVSGGDVGGGMALVLGAVCKPAAIPQNTPLCKIVSTLVVDLRVARVNRWLGEHKPSIAHLKWVVAWHCCRHTIPHSNFRAFKDVAGLVGNDLRMSLIRKPDVENLLRYMSLGATPFDCEAGQQAYIQRAWHSTTCIEGGFRCPAFEVCSHEGPCQ